eukprot:scaffold12132_cov103-Isochrysis_galbana.AAC.9
MGGRGAAMVYAWWGGMVGPEVWWWVGHPLQSRRLEGGERVGCARTDRMYASRPAVLPGGSGQAPQAGSLQGPRDARD